MGDGSTRRTLPRTGTVLAVLRGRGVAFDQAHADHRLRELLAAPYAVDVTLFVAGTDRTVLQLTCDSVEKAYGVFSL